MRISLFGGLRVEHDGAQLTVSGAMQLAVLIRLAVDAGSSVSYRAIVEDVWALDAPENERAALQSVVSRLRSQLPAGAIESTVGGYRLVVSRGDVDILVFQDLVTDAGRGGADAARLASQALALWTGEPWIPGPAFDWLEQDLRADRAAALALGGVAAREPQRRTIRAPLTSLVGREQELASIAAQLAASRLVTIVGTGGAGKTRLALEAAVSWPALLVELAPVGEGEVLSAILAASGRDIRTETKATEQTAVLDRVTEALFGRELLLVLDNCEHVVSEAAVAAESLLEALPRLRILATSREPLAIPGEAFVAVGSLPPAEALELLGQRVSAARGRAPDGSEVETARRVCARLDGLPLAIELAAARTRSMSLVEVLDGLEHRFTLLTGGYRTALPRHQTLRALIDWSWSLLDDDERRVLSGLAVFPSGVDASEAGMLATRLGAPSASVFDSLVDKSLLERSRGRFRTLETIREYGLEHLAEVDGIGAARELQARHQSERAAAMDALLRGPRINEAITWFDAEEENLSAALRTSIAVPLADTAVSLVTSCTWYWILRDRQDDARQWYAHVIPLAEHVMGEAAHVLHLVGPVTEALSAMPSDDETFMEESLPTLLAPLSALRSGAGSHDVLQLIPAAISAFTAAGAGPDWMTRVHIPIGEELGLDPWPTAVLHVLAAAMAQNRGDVGELGDQSDIGLRLFLEIGDLWGIALASEMRAQWLVLQGRLEEALAVSDSATEKLRSITSSWDLAQQRGLAIQVLVRLGRTDEARQRVDEILAEAESSGNTMTVLQAYVLASSTALELGDLEAAREHLLRVDERLSDWPRRPGQLQAFAAGAKAALALADGELDEAEAHLREAALVAFTTHDQPVIGYVAIGVGTLALARGDIHRAIEAVDLAAVLIGAHDLSNPHVAEIERAARDAGIGRPDARALDRPKALEALKGLVDG